MQETPVYLPAAWVAVVNADRGLAAIAAVEESGQEKTRCIVSNAEFQLNNAAPWGGGVVGQRHLPDRRIGQSRNAVVIGKVQRQRRFSQRAVVSSSADRAVQTNCIIIGFSFFTISERLTAAKCGIGR